MNRQKLIDNAIYLIVRDGQTKEVTEYPKDFGLHEGLVVGDESFRCSSFDYNKHHFIPKYFYKKVLPILSKLLDFPYSENDFYLNKNVVNYENGDVIDFSYFTPVNENFKFLLSYYELKSLDNAEIMAFFKQKEVGFEDISPVKSVFNHEFLEKLNGGIFGPYHKLFVGAHNCVRIVNKTLSNGRKIILSTDSHSIPLIPILICYYETVVVLDNRNYINLYDNLTKDIEDAQSLFVMAAKNNYKKWFEQNLQ